MATYLSAVSQMRANLEKLKERQLREDQYEYDELGGRYIPRATINSWKIIPTLSITDSAAKHAAFRLNSQANLFYFAVQVLRKTKFQLNPDLKKNLHFQMCMVVMKDGLKEVIEIPRDHFKSTVYSECFPIWRALPFSQEDQDLMCNLGATDRYIEWMKRAHNQDIRIILVSEVTKNAEKLGRRTRNHYENNQLFRQLFPEILPTSKSTWTNTSLHQTRSSDSVGDGEGTFDFIGVGGALQSTHYDLAIQDDLVGREALKSETVMTDTIEYHQLLAGAINADNTDAKRDFDEIVVGNRWSYKDLNSYIRDKEPYFNFITHSALGGCCPLHPIGVPIFPEAFSIEKLARYKKRFGTYFFSCQWLNFPVNPERCKFELSNLRYFHYVADDVTLGAPILDHDKDSKTPIKPKIRVKIKHHVFEGDVEEDIYPRNLSRFMVVDPNHNGAKGRCRHAITVTGVRQDIRRVYLLKAWAKASAIGEFVDEIFKTAIAFKLTKIHLETIAAQKYLKFHLEYFIIVNKNKPEWAGIENIVICDLESKNNENAKTDRIDSFIPVTERREFWMDANGCEQVIEEMETYGNRGALIDILDTLGYGPQVWKFDDVDEEDLRDLLIAQQNRFTRAMANA
jgi:hypothetical protein